MFFVLTASFGLLFVLIAWPMAKGLVEPNGAYGFRTPRTLSDPAIWYPANRAAGRAMMVAGATTILGSPSLLFVTDEQTAEKALVAWLTIPLSVAMVYSFVYLARLPRSAGDSPGGNEGIRDDSTRAPGA